jgi:LuxR family maltose regulon positive regulatory protein
VAVVGGLIYALLGRPGPADRCLAAAERGPAGGTLADGSTVAGYVDLGRAFLCRQGAERQRADAQAAQEGLAPENTLQGLARLLDGVGWLLEGQPDRADQVLAGAVEVTVQDRAMPAAATALGERALLALGRHDWEQAAALVDQALGTVRSGRLEDYPHSAFVHALAARTALHRGDGPAAREHLARAARLRPLLTYGLSWLSVQTLLELARAYLALDDAAGARTALRQARDVLQQRPDLGDLPAQARELEAALERAGATGAGASSLTAAELRLVPLLSTHLSFREIGERLYLSRNTVKTQAISVYRKLAVSSRAEAVERVRELGLL